jgi:Uma2 family endonuclease
MKAGALVPVEEYLRASYHPDCDYVDGEVLERNTGERDHSRIQRELIFFFRSRQQEWNAFVFPEQRVQVSPSRFRVPDICVYLGGEPQEQIFATPPFICIEILSPEDRWERSQQRIDDYIQFGVPNVWVFNPREKRAWAYTTQGSIEIKDGVLRTLRPSLNVPLAEIFGQS